MQAINIECVVVWISIINHFLLLIFTINLKTANISKIFDDRYRTLSEIFMSRIFWRIPKWNNIQGAASKIRKLVWATFARHTLYKTFLPKKRATENTNWRVRGFVLLPFVYYRISIRPFYLADMHCISLKPLFEWPENNNLLTLRFFVRGR